jgi:hypothetical protein
VGLRRWAREHQRQRTVVVGGVVLGMVVAGTWWLRPWDDQLERRVADLCGGTLAVGETMDLVATTAEFVERLGGSGAGEVRIEEVRSVDEGGERFARCRFGGYEATVTRITPESEGVAFEDVAVPNVGYGLPVPLGSGWTGYHGGAVVLVAVPCAGSRDSLAVEAENIDMMNEVLADDPDTRSAVTAMVTATALHAAEEWDCRIGQVRPLRTAPPPVSWETRELPAEADGTCAGLPLARVPQVTNVWETVTAADALVESCPLGAAGQRRYQLDAYFGPSAQIRLGLYADYGSFSLPSRAGQPAGSLADAGRSDYLDDVELWGTASCPTDAGHRQPALFEVRLGPSAEADAGGRGPSWAEPATSSAVLADFARQAAQRHGCTQLHLP